jgi:hypothetical protein
MPAGGFGNLIALPLQGLARSSGNTEFIDESFFAISGSVGLPIRD